MLCSSDPSGCDSWCVVLSQWLWIIVCYAELVVVHHVCYAEPNSYESCYAILSLVCFRDGVSCRAIGCEWYEPVVGNCGVLCWTSGCETWCVIMCKLFWIKVCNAEQVVVSHGELCWASSSETCCAMLSQWLWIMVCYAEPVVMSHSELCWARGCGSWCVMLSQWLWIMVCYAVPVVVNYAVLCWWTMVSYSEPVAVNHGLLCCASGSESWWVMLCQWLWIMLCYAELVVVHHVCYAEPNSYESCYVILSRLCLSYGVSCRAIGCEWYEPVDGNYGVLCSTSGWESWCVILCKLLWIMVCNAEQVVASHGV
jgi:hypothetical protein